MKSCVLIIPAALQAPANQLGELMGWGPGSYSVPLSANGSEPATHFGLHTWVTPAFKAMVAGAAQGQMPEALEQGGYPPETFAAIMGALIVSIRDDMGGHFDDITAANGLQRVEVVE